MAQSRHILPTIVFAQFCGTSLWFAGNAVLGNLMTDFSLPAGVLGNLTSSVQLGFILGTLAFALFTIADRFSPSHVFLFCSIAGALFNSALVWEGNSLTSILTLRMLTGFFLAGIYPVGMKIAADYYSSGLGKSLGFLVGALVLGTAFPHLLKGISDDLPWKKVIGMVSVLAVTGGVILAFLVPDGPYRKKGTQLHFTAFFQVFHNARFRSSAFGYFGHMWELYTFWAFVPVMLSTYAQIHSLPSLNIPRLSFFIIGSGGVACAVGGYVSNFAGVKKTATWALSLSGLCCIMCPFMFKIGSPVIFVAFLFFWGWVVIADSPLFSTLVAQNAPGELKATGLTIVNCIGFSITIVSIQLISSLQKISITPAIYALLAIGPALGILALTRRKVA